MARKKTATATATTEADNAKEATTPVVEHATAKKPRKKRAAKKKPASKRKAKKADAVAETKKADAEAKADAKADAKTTQKASAAAVAAAPKAVSASEPCMWASHQFHKFATAQLDAMHRFTREKLVELMTVVYEETDGEKIEQNVQAILGKKPIRIRKVKDPDRPSKPLTGYQIFCRDFHADEKKSGAAKKSLIDLSREQSKRWRGLTDKEKSKYLKRASELKDKYKSDLEVYKERRKPVVTPITV